MLRSALRYQLMRAVPGVCPCGVNLRSISRAAALAAWVCSQHQTFEWSHSQSAIALVLPQASLDRLGRALPRRKSDTPAVRPYQLHAGASFRSGGDACSAALRLCSQHQTFEWSHSQSAIALVLP